MIETTSSLEPFEVDDLDAATLLELAAEAEAQSRAADRRKLRLAAHWCVLHPATPDTGTAAWGETGLPGLDGCTDRLGGEGTPDLAAFSPEPFAVALGISPVAGMSLLADALDLVHRLPALWRGVEELRLPGWRARRVAELTRSLSLEAARWVDERLAPHADSLGWRRVEEVLALAVARFHPDRVEAHHRRGTHGWDVRLHRDPDSETHLAGTAHLEATGDVLDLSRFFDLVCDTAAQLGALGDGDPLGARKAKALGVIADTQTSLDLLSVTDQRTHVGGQAVDPSAAARRRLAKISLYLHLSLADLTLAGPRVEGLPEPRLGTAERLGPVSIDQIKEWVGHSQVTVTPVLDLARETAHEPHDPPPWMREQVILRDRRCVFPGCARDARRCDLDHIEPYDDTGPPGQTRPENLAPLCRRHHRAKTFGRWRYARLPDGAFVWVSPQGTAQLVTPQGTMRTSLC